VAATKAQSTARVEPDGTGITAVTARLHFAETGEAGVFTLTASPGASTKAYLAETATPGEYDLTLTPGSATQARPVQIGTVATTIG
jgi:hypothetical protein